MNEFFKDLMSVLTDKEEPVLAFVVAILVILLTSLLILVIIGIGNVLVPIILVIIGLYFLYKKFILKI